MLVDFLPLEGFHQKHKNNQKSFQEFVKFIIYVLKVKS